MNTLKMHQNNPKMMNSMGTYQTHQCLNSGLSPDKH